jgi:hypothetical protein
MQHFSHSSRILVAGVYLADQPNNVASISRNMASSAGLGVSQCWAAIGLSRQSDVPQPALRVRHPQPKFSLINALLARVDLAAFEYVIVCDDDISLPPRFLDDFIALQRRLDFRLAQPARTPGSHIDHDIVCQQEHCVARQTLFVECGPLFSMHRSVTDLLVPFDTESPMGWGYEYVWSWRLAQRYLRMGIVDCVPVEHRMRVRGSCYSVEEARHAERKLLSSHPHHPRWVCMQNLRYYCDA